MINSQLEKKLVDLSMDTEGYAKGLVRCTDCLNLESYWKNGTAAFFMCRVKPLAFKKLKSRWIHCRSFMHTNDSALNRKNNIK
jgi:hypothetical protein